jgi:hypothetical protein
MPRISPEEFGIDAMLFQKSAEIATILASRTGGQSHVSVVLRHGVREVISLKAIDCHPFQRREGTGIWYAAIELVRRHVLPDWRAEVIDVYRVRLSEVHCADDSVLEFSHVAGPVVCD